MMTSLVWRNVKFTFSGWSWLLAVGLVLTGALESCTEEEIAAEIVPETGSESYFTKSLDFASEGGESILAFTTNKSWTMTLSQSGGEVDWCSFSPAQGEAGTHEVKVRTTSNASLDDRNAVLILTAGELTRKVVVTQKQKDAITLTTAKYEVDESGGIIDVQIQANVPYEVVVPEEYRNWIKQLATTRAVETTNLKFEIAPSEEYEKREGEIIIRNNDLSETLKVYQAGSAILLLSKSEYLMTDEGGEVVVEVSSNFEFEVEGPAEEWVTRADTKSVSTHTLRYNVAPNETYDEREAMITLKDKKSDKQESVIIRQAQKDAILLSSKDYSISAEGGQIEVEVNTNIAFDVKFSTGCNWISRVETRALTTHKLLFDIQPNETEEERTASVIFYNLSDESLADTLRVVQATAYSGAVDLGLSVKWASCNVGADKPEDSGGWYGWADPTGELTITPVWERNESLSAYEEKRYNCYAQYYGYDNPPSNISGTDLDIARVQWGGTWRMPTRAEMQELFTECQWTRVDNGGYRVTSKTNGNSIYLPLGGYRSEESIKSWGSVGYYWTGTLDASMWGEESIYSACCFCLDSWFMYTQFGNPERSLGCSVRPVTDGTKTHAPKVSETILSNITQTTAHAVAEIVDDGDLEITQKGFYLSPNRLFKESEAKCYLASDNGNTIDVVFDDLVSGHTYYIWAFAANERGRRFSKVTHFSAEVTSGEEIDLGLSVKWASHNVGAEKPEEHGGLYGWGDGTGEMTSTDSDDYPLGDKDPAGTSRDVASVKWGNGWRLPLASEASELAALKWEWVYYKDVGGFLVTANNGNTIFLPDCGQRNGTEIKYQGSQAYFHYWTGSIVRDAWGGYNAGVLYYSQSGHYANIGYGSRSTGYPVRPVRKTE